jgi:hypothetical protein
MLKCMCTSGWHHPLYGLCTKYVLLRPLLSKTRKFVQETTIVPVCIPRSNRQRSGPFPISSASLRVSRIVDIGIILNVKVLISIRYDVNINGAAFWHCY